MRGTASSDAPEGEAAPLQSIMRSDGRSGKELRVKYREGESFSLGCQVMAAVRGCLAPCIIERLSDSVCQSDERHDSRSARPKAGHLASAHIVAG
jgi:hypothetical protein